MKRLNAENKRLKKSKDIDKDEVEYDESGNDITINVIECCFCKTGYMQEIYVVGRNFYKCLDCGRTKKK